MRWRSCVIAAIGLVALVGAARAQGTYGIGRPATPAEIEGWNIDVDRDGGNLHFATLAAEFLQDVRIAQNQVVLRTAPGHANSVAVALDDEEWPEVVGTIAGDDTILVICPDSITAEAVRTKLIGLLES